jgi:hypothetical protein
MLHRNIDGPFDWLSIRSRVTFSILNVVSALGSSGRKMSFRCVGLKQGPLPFISTIIDKVELKRGIIARLQLVRLFRFGPSAHRSVTRQLFVMTFLCLGLLSGVLTFIVILFFIFIITFSFGRYAFFSSRFLLLFLKLLRSRIWFIT